MSDHDRRMFLLGTVGAIAIFAIVFVVVSFQEIIDSLLSTEPPLIVVTFLLALCWLAAWSLMLRTILAVFGVDIPASKSFFVYAGAIFANNITPFGQAGVNRS